jgi:hypothetical protein
MLKQQRTERLTAERSVPVAAAGAAPLSKTHPVPQRGQQRRRWHVHRGAPHAPFTNGRAAKVPHKKLPASQSTRRNFAPRAVCEREAAASAYTVPEDNFRRERSKGNQSMSRPFAVRRTIAAIATAAALGTGWALFRPELLLVNQTVNEPFPVARAAAAAAPAKTSHALSSGRFQSIAHGTMGTATVHQLPNNKRVLRLSGGFATSNGPDLRVYLVAAKTATNDASVKQAGFLDLGRLKGNRGDQNYALPDGVDLARYGAVSIWCRRFGVNFAAASLAPTTG